MLNKRMLLAEKGTAVRIKDPQELAGTEMDIKQLDCYCVSKREDTEKKSLICDI